MGVFFALPKAVSQATQETHILQLIRQFQKKSCATLFVKQEKDKAKKPQNHKYSFWIEVFHLKA